MVDFFDNPDILPSYNASIMYFNTITQQQEIFNLHNAVMDYIKKLRTNHYNNEYISRFELFEYELSQYLIKLIEHECDDLLILENECPNFYNFMQRKIYNYE
jgi:hypothetical protein